MNGGPWQSIPEASRRSVSEARTELDQREGGYEQQLDHEGRRTCGVHAAVRKPTNTLTP
ncbi:MAG TPA: hypothetical protein PLE77_11625 [Kiritimatiellia bacterium]|nr:hypothetical protein [Kiritimatiellia bacterium]